MSSFKNLEMILARDFDALFALKSPYTGKAAVVHVDSVSEDIALSDVPGRPDFIGTVTWLTVGDSTGNYEAVAVIIPDLPVPIQLIFHEGL